MDLKPVCAWNIDQFPKTDKTEICFIGRSNAGKSTLINALTKSKSAYVAKAAGKTKSINFFEQKNYCLVDMPGYGFSKNSHTQNSEIEKLINVYFSERQELSGVIHICCILGLTDQDLAMSSFLSGIRSNYLLVLNKCDKLGKMQQAIAKKKILEATNLPEQKVILISSKKAINTGSVISVLNNWSKP